MEKEKGIPRSLLAEKIATAIGNAIRRDMGASEDSVVDINPDTGRFYVAMRKTVVDDLLDPAQEILRRRLSNTTAAPRSATLLKSRLTPSNSGASPRRQPSTSSARVSARPSAGSFSLSFPHASTIL